MQINRLLTIIILLAAIPACDLTDVNLNPNERQQAPLRQQLPGLCAATAFNQVGETARIYGILLQQFTGLEAPVRRLNSYDLTPTTLDDFWREGLYGGALKDAWVLREQARTEERPYYEGIADILLAVSLAKATLTFGDAPFGEAFRGNGERRPVYDRQELVLDSVLQLLDASLRLLRQPERIGAPAEDDLYFRGDVAAWRRTAYALRARYLLTLSNRRPEVLEMIPASLDSAFQEASGQPVFVFTDDPNGNNPLAKFGFERFRAMGFDGRFAALLQERDDPRLERYAERVGDRWDYYSDFNDQLYWAQNDSPLPLISLAELHFIRAEVRWLREEGRAAVEEALRAAIRANMEEIGIPEGDYNGYLNRRAGLSGLNGVAIRRRILEEAYVAYYGYAFQQIWNNYRRTGIPELTPNPEAATGFNPSGQIPTRMLYPSSERENNAANVERAAQAQGGALLDAPLWVFE